MVLCILSLHFISLPPDFSHYLIQSCGPNAAVQWNLGKLMLSLYTLRPICEEEEINKVYLDPTLPRATRIAILQKNYRFLCDRPWCNIRKTGGAVDDDNLTTAELKLIADSDQRRPALERGCQGTLGIRNGTWISLAQTIWSS